MSALRFVRLASWALVIALTVGTAVVLWRGDTIAPAGGDGGQPQDDDTGRDGARGLLVDDGREVERGTQETHNTRLCVAPAIRAKSSHQPDPVSGCGGP